MEEFDLALQDDSGDESDQEDNRIRPIHITKRGIVIGMGADSLGWQLHWNKPWRNLRLCLSSYGRGREDNNYHRHRMLIIEALGLHLWFDLGKL